MKEGCIMYLVSVFEKAAIDICIEGGFAPWTVVIDCIKCVTM